MTLIKNISGKKVSEHSPSWVKTGIQLQKMLGLKYLNKKITKKCEEKKNNKDVENFAKQYNIKYKSVERCSGFKTPKQCWDSFKNQNEFFIRRRKNLPTPSSEFIRDISEEKKDEYLPIPKSKEKIENDYYHWVNYVRNFHMKKLFTIPNPRTSINKENEKKYEKKLFVSPADCFSIYLTNTNLEKKLWIKGNNFSVDDLFGEKIKNLNDNQLFIFRLAPQHYHRYHSPITGSVLSIKYLGSEYYSVNPSIVNSKVDVFTENIRVVLRIQNVFGDEIYLAIVGATCVGSIEITNPAILLGKIDNKKFENKTLFKKKKLIFDKPLPKIKLFDELGNFQFGGSTIVALIPKTYHLSEVGKTIKMFSEKSQPSETEISVGYPLGLC